MIVPFIFALVIHSVLGLTLPEVHDQTRVLEDDGGYITEPEQVQFVSRYVDQYGVVHMNKPQVPTILVQASTRVSEKALIKAANTIGHMIRHSPFDVFFGVSHSKGLGVFTRQETLGVFPENRNLLDTPDCQGSCNGTCHHTCTTDGRKFQFLAGVTNIRSAVIEDNVLCTANDPYGHALNVVTHEFSHQIYKNIPSSYRTKIQEAYTYAKQHHIWVDSYATSTAHEYWAEGTTAFFMTSIRSKSMSGGMNQCEEMTIVCPNEIEARKNIKAKDPKLFEILEDVYTNRNALIPSGLRPCM